MRWRPILPQDIPGCVNGCELAPAYTALNTKKEVSALLVRLMIEDRLWGAVVEKAAGEEPVCFGAGIFVDHEFRERMVAGDFAIPIAAFATNPELQRHILEFPQIEKASQSCSLCFLDALFTFPKWTDPRQFGKALYHLQDSFVSVLGGYGMSHHYKHVLGTVHAKLMQHGFGVDPIVRPRTSHEALARQLGLHLMGATREQALERIGRPIHEMMVKGTPVLNLSLEARKVLRLELRGYTRSEIEKSLGKGKGSAENNWNTAVETMRRSPEVAELIGLDTGGQSNRVRILEYLRQHPEELAVLPHLTPEEKQHAAQVASSLL